jgi:serpin B
VRIGYAASVVVRSLSPGGFAMPRPRVVLAPLALFAVVACTLPATVFPPRDGLHRPAASEQEVARAVESVNAFSADLYAQLRTTSGNLVVSPYSVSMALNMTALGAEGTTLEEMQKVLHVPAGSKLAPAFGEVADAVVTPPKGAKHRPELSVANSLWIQKGRPWKKEFLAAARGDFHAGVFEANFAREPEVERGRINKWVEKETRERIKDLVPPGAIVSDTRIVLANAIYFKARWAEAFKKDDTKPMDFTLSGGGSVQAPTMHQSGKFSLLENDTLQVLKLPYDGKATSMYVLLPRLSGKDQGLSLLEEKLTAANLKQWITHPGGEEEVRVWLPKFKFTVPTELGEVLQKMGMREAFDGVCANFAGMTDDPRGAVISRVIHKAFVELDEQGTEAAAATAVVGLARASAVQHPPQVKEFRADRPFLFVIKHEGTGAVLFVGRVTDPTK